MTGPGSIELRIKQIREARGWSQRELASRAHIAPGHLSDIENGRRPFNARTLRQVSDALGVRPVDLISGTVVDGGDNVSVDDIVMLVLTLSAENRATVLHMLRGLVQGQDRQSPE